MRKSIKVAVVPIPPVTETGKQFDLRFSKLPDIIKFLEQEQPFEVIVFQDESREEISGKNNKEKGENLKKFLSKK